jgi:hypothetical protein
MSQCPNTGLTFADLVRREGAKQRSCSPAYLATKRRAAMPEVERLMKASQLMEKATMGWPFVFIF